MSAYTDADERSDNSERIWESAMRKIGEDHLAKADPMTQPHNIDREAVKARLASILIDLTDPDEPCPSEADIARAIIDAMIALSAPMEAVAALSSRPVDDTGGEFSGVNPKAVAWREEIEVAAVQLQLAAGWLREAGDDGQRANTLLNASNRARQALAVIPTQGPTEREIQDAMDALRPLRWKSEDSLREAAEKALAASTPVGGWPADDPLHDAIRQLRQHMTTIQAAKQASAAGQPQGMGPIWNLVNALPAIVRQLDAAELDIEAAFEQYEDRAPAPASDTTGMETGT